MIAPEIRHEDFEFACIVWVLFIVGCEDVGALDGLHEESEDIVAEKDTSRGVGAAGYVLPCQQ